MGLSERQLVLQRAIHSMLSPGGWFTALPELQGTRRKKDMKTKMLTSSTYSPGCEYNVLIPLCILHSRLFLQNVSTVRVPPV